MPKDYRERRIDNKPPRVPTMHGKRDATEIAVPGDVTPDPFPEPGPDGPVMQLISTFTGSGSAGTVNTHAVGPLMAGDIYLVVRYGSGYLSISPELYQFSGTSISAGSIGARVYKAGSAPNGAGATSLSVTINSAPMTYYGWILRGGYYGDTSSVATNTDYAKITYDADIHPNPDPCSNEIIVTDWTGPATVVAPRSGSFGAYGAHVTGSPCSSLTPEVIVFGGNSEVLNGQYYKMGTLADGAGTMTVQSSISKHDITANLILISVAPKAA